MNETRRKMKRAEQLQGVARVVALDEVHEQLQEDRDAALLLAIRTRGAQIEIARELGISRAAVSYRVQNARKRIDRPTARRPLAGQR